MILSTNIWIHCPMPGKHHHKTFTYHTSGIKDYAHDFPGYPFIEKDRKQEITEAQFIRMATNLPLNFQPGERWAYSNSNFVLLGFIIHKLSWKANR